MNGLPHHLVLGGDGFIGRHVSLVLARRGHRVTIADRTPQADRPRAAELRALRHESVDLARADWDRLLADVDVVHHYAWSSIPATAQVNPTGDLLLNMTVTLGLLDAMRKRGGGRIVFASSGGTVYGKLRKLPATEDDPLAPITAYGAGKATAEAYLTLYRTQHGLDCRIARISNPFGAGQDPARGLGAVTTFARRALDDQPITIWGNGEVVRDYVHISDVAAGLADLACAPPLGSEFIFNLGCGRGVSLNDIVAELQRQLGRPLRVSRNEPRDFDMPVNVLAIGLAGRRLGWTPRLSFSEGVARTLADLERGMDLSTIDENPAGSIEAGPASRSDRSQDPFSPPYGGASNVARREAQDVR